MKKRDAFKKHLIVIEDLLISGYPNTFNGYDSNVVTEAHLGEENPLYDY
ncbi:MAG: hypothetical protein RRZ24_02130 [Clostridia bacterium]